MLLNGLIIWPIKSVVKCKICSKLEFRMSQMNYDAGITVSAFCEF